MNMARVTKPFISQTSTGVHFPFSAPQTNLLRVATTSKEVVATRSRLIRPYRVKSVLPAKGDFSYTVALMNQLLRARIEAHGLTPTLACVRSDGGRMIVNNTVSRNLRPIAYLAPTVCLEPAREMCPNTVQCDLLSTQTWPTRRPVAMDG
jgi:hypothetical protein